MANTFTAGQSVVVRVDTKKLDAIMKGDLEKALQRIVEGAAFDVERLAKIAAPIDTGAMANSIHATLSWRETGGHTSAVAAARAARPDVGVHPEVKPVAGPGEVTAIVAAAVEYAGYVEFGTSRMAARPFLRGALNQVKKDFQEAARAELGGLAR